MDQFTNLRRGNITKISNGKLIAYYHFFDNHLLLEDVLYPDLLPKLFQNLSKENIFQILADITGIDEERMKSNSNQISFPERFQWNNEIIEVDCRRINNKLNLTIKLSSVEVDNILGLLEELEDLIQTISRSFLFSKLSEIDKTIHNTLMLIGKYFNADRAYIFQLDSKKDTISNSHEWVSSGTKPQIHNLQNLPRSEFEEFDKVLRNGDPYYLTDTKKLVSENERRLLESQNIQSLILVPFFGGDEYEGFLGIDSVKGQVIWNSVVKSLMSVLSEIIQRGIKRAEIEDNLGKSYQHYLDLIEKTPIGILIHQNYKISSINPMGRQILQIPKESTASYNLEKFISDNSSVNIQEVANHTYLGYETSWMEIKIKTLKEKERIIKYLQIPYKNKKQRAALGFFQDITLEKKFRTELAESEQKYKSLFNSSLDAIYISTVDGKLIDWNPSFNRIFGYSNEELAEIDTNDLYFDKEDRETFVKSLRAQPVQENVEVKLKHKKGYPLYGLISFNTIIENGEIKQMHGIIKDITDLHLATQALVESEKLNSMGVLAGGIAHDINNMLTSISGYADLIEFTSQESETVEMSSKLQISADRIRDLTDKLLAYAGKKIKFKQLFDLDEEIRSIHDFLSIAVSNTVIFNYRLNSNAKVNLDKTQFSQIMMNLATNAVESTDSTNILIEVATEVQNLTTIDIRSYDLFEPLSFTSGNYCKVSVIDNGDGMTKETLHRIFEPFYTTKFEGRGLGLSASLGIIKNHNGAIGVNSELERGTSFDIFLPIEHSEENALEKINVIEETINESNYSNILMIDDKIEILEVATQILEYLNIELQTTTNVNEFFSFFENNAYDLIIVDQTMPYISGVEIIEKLRETYNYTGDIFLMSGYSRKYLDEHFENLNINDFIHKPLTLEVFKNKLQRSSS